MEEKIIRESEAFYFKSATNLLGGRLVMTNQRIFYSGVQQRVKLNHGAMGNMLRDKMEEAMGYGSEKEDFIFSIPLADVTHSIKRFGLSKRLVIGDGDGNEYKLSINNKPDRNEWPAAIDAAKKG